MRKDVKLVYISWWSDDRAEYFEQYKIAKLKRNWRGKKVWKYEQYYTPVGGIDITGNREWAKKQAKHYGIELPKAIKK